jgi:hypothetical protein
MKNILTVPARLAIILSNFIGKIIILITFIVGSGFYWLTIGLFAFLVWTLLLVVTFFWTVVEVFIGRMKQTIQTEHTSTRKIAHLAK